MEPKPTKKNQEEPGPERPEDESQIGVKYLDYEELQDFSAEDTSKLDEVF